MPFSIARSSIASLLTLSNSLTSSTFTGLNNPSFSSSVSMLSFIISCESITDFGICTIISLFASLITTMIWSISTPAFITPSHFAINDFVVKGTLKPNNCFGSSNLPASVYKYSIVASSPISLNSDFIKSIITSLVATVYFAVGSESLSILSCISLTVFSYFSEAFEYPLKNIVNNTTIITPAIIVSLITFLLYFFSPFNFLKSSSHNFILF